MRQVKEKKFIVPPKVPVPSNSYSNEGTAAGTKTICFDVIYGYICSDGYSATTAICDK